MLEPKTFLLRPGESLSLILYRCPNCGNGFGVEETAAGPRHCPACGAAFGQDTATLNCSPEQLAKLAKALNMDPSALLSFMRAAYFAVRMSG